MYLTSSYVEALRSAYRCAAEGGQDTAPDRTPDTRTTTDTERALAFAWMAALELSALEL